MFPLLKNVGTQRRKGSNNIKTPKLRMIRFDKHPITHHFMSNSRTSMITRKYNGKIGRERVNLTLTEHSRIRCCVHKMCLVL